MTSLLTKIRNIATRTDLGASARIGAVLALLDADEDQRKSRLAQFKLAIEAFHPADDAVEPVGESGAYESVAILSTGKMEASDRSLALVPTRKMDEFKLILQDAGGWQEEVGLLRITHRRKERP